MAETVRPLLAAFNHRGRSAAAEPCDVFYQTDLYSTVFGFEIDDEIERRLFGEIDRIGAAAVETVKNPVEMQEVWWMHCTLWAEGIFTGEFLQIAARGSRLTASHDTPAKKGYFWGYISVTVAQRSAEKRHAAHRSIPSLIMSHGGASCARRSRLTGSAPSAFSTPATMIRTALEIAPGLKRLRQMDVNAPPQ